VRGKPQGRNGSVTSSPIGLACFELLESDRTEKPFRASVQLQSDIVEVLRGSDVNSGGYGRPSGPM